MKQFITFSLAALLTVGNNVMAEDGITILDLSSAANSTEFTFDANGAWDNLYSGTTASEVAYDYFDSQFFRMSHMGYSDYGGYFEGFAPCVSTDMTDQSSYSVGCMAGGGIMLDDTGNIVSDDAGNVSVDASMPYLVGYYSTYYNSPSSCQIQFSDGSHEMVGMYVTNFPMSFYNCLYGNGYARAFVNGDSLTLTVHGVAADQSEKTVDIDLIRYEDGMFQAVRGWKYVDLSSLGTVELLYFTMSSTDSSEWGINTATYFCIDKIMAKTEVLSGVSAAAVGAKGIKYDRVSKEVILPQGEFSIIYNANGQKVMVGDGARLSVEGLPNGLYVVKTASGDYLKFIK